MSVDELAGIELEHASTYARNMEELGHFYGVTRITAMSFVGFGRFVVSQEREVEFSPRKKLKI